MKVPVAEPRGVKVTVAEPIKLEKTRTRQCCQSLLYDLHRLLISLLTPFL